MGAKRKSNNTAQFGDFQTPVLLASRSTELLRRLGVKPRTILEPTCGRGSFLFEAARTFPEASRVIGVEINPTYVESALEQTGINRDAPSIQVLQGDFFTFDWKGLFQQQDEPWLILGNPPWVTSSHLSTLGSGNVPKKTNFHGRTGIEAVTGKSNFDISEWMLSQYIEWLGGTGTIAVLCKTSVARKVLLQAGKRHLVSSSRMYGIDALAEFGAAVDACFFVLELALKSPLPVCLLFSTLEDSEPSSTLSIYKGRLISDGGPQHQMDSLWGPDEHYTWRSGIKHDCSGIMELTPAPNGYVNSMGDDATLEDRYLFPVLKGSDIGNARTTARGVMLVTQQRVGEDTSVIERVAPYTWAYLNRHGTRLDERGSVIYRNKPRFSIFGVGEYTFSPWKVAVSSLYKRLRFVTVGPVGNKPVVFDDTVYFLSCWSEAEARFVSDLLHSNVAQGFFGPMIHWSDKRAITIDILKRISLQRLATQLGRQEEYDLYTWSAQPRLFAS